MWVTPVAAPFPKISSVSSRTGEASLSAEPFSPDVPSDSFVAGTTVAVVLYALGVPFLQTICEVVIPAPAIDVNFTSIFDSGVSVNTAGALGVPLLHDELWSTVTFTPLVVSIL